LKTSYPNADMAKHGVTITNQLFGTVTSDISNLNQIVKTGQSLSYTMGNLDGTFRLRFLATLPQPTTGSRIRPGVNESR